MNALAATRATFQLRCDRCGRALDTLASAPMQVACLVKPGIGPQIPELPEEERRRCRGCGFVNIFVPLRERELLRSV